MRRIQPIDSLLNNFLDGQLNLSLKKSVKFGQINPRKTPICLKIYSIYWMINVAVLFFVLLDTLLVTQGKMKPAERRACITECPTDCQLGEWQNWSSCTKSCGPGAIRIRYTHLVVLYSFALFTFYFCFCALLEFRVINSSYSCK